MYSFRVLIYVLLLCAIPLSLSDCSKNDSDDSPSDLIEGILTEAQIQLNLQLWGISYNANWGSLMAQHWTNPVDEGRTLYAVRGIDFDEFWLGMFIQVLSPLREVKNLIDDRDASDAVKTNQKAIADILTVYAFSHLTDGYGDIPVLQFLDNDDATQPRYDRQEVIYDRLLTLLDQAISQLDESASSFNTGDIIYNGDVGSWKKFAYSLMLRMAMRIADADAGKAETYVNKTLDKVFTSNSDNALFVFSGSPTITNPIYAEVVINNRNNFYVTNQFLNQLTSTNDPRLMAFVSTNPSGNYVGLPYGGQSDLLDTISQPGEEISKIDAPAIILDYAEVEFLLAEAYQRNFLTGSPSQAYERGIRASMEFWEVIDQTAINDYVSSNTYDAPNWRSSLGTQKWLAFFANGSQAWAEWRRLDSPQLTAPSDAIFPSIPVKLPYPDSEQTSNAEQLEMITTNPNDIGTKVWWDVN